MIFWQHAPFTEHAEPVPQGFLILIEGEMSKHEEIQKICHQNNKLKNYWRFLSKMYVFSYKAYPKLAF